MQEQEIREIEEQFPLLAGKAFANARKATLEAGLSVIESENGWLVKTYPNGARRNIKKIDNRCKCVAGTYKI